MGGGTRRRPGNPVEVSVPPLHRAVFFALACELAGICSPADSARAALPLVAYITSPDGSSPHGGSALPIVGGAGGDDFVSYRLEYRHDQPATDWVPIAGPVLTPVVNGELGVWDISSLPAGLYVVRVVVDGTAGASASWQISIYLSTVVITEPRRDDTIGPGASLDVRGRVLLDDFVRYTVEYQVSGPDFRVEDWTTTGITLAGGGTTQVSDGVLATLDRSVLPADEGRNLAFRVTAYTSTSSRDSYPIADVIVDPTLRPGWPRQLTRLRTSGGFPVDAEVHNAPTIADLDADGTKEILVALGGFIYALRPDGSDLSGWPVALADDDELEGAESGPSAADLDHDGLLEVAAARGDTLYLLHHDGTPVAGWPKSFPGLGGHDVTLADLDGDGTPEIVFASAAGLEAVDPSGQALPGFPTPLPDGEFGEGVTVGDVDGDGSPELALTWKEPRAGSSRRRQWVYLFNAQGRLKPRWPRKTGQRSIYVDGPDVPPIMADFDGDGVLDVAAVTNSPRHVRLYRGDGHSIPAPHDYPDVRVLEYNAGTRRNRFTQDGLSAGDITGDGRPELFVSTDFYTLCLFDSCVYGGKFDFLSAIDVGVGNAPGWPVGLEHWGRWKEHGAGTPAIGDLDGDGLPEAVTGSGLCRFWPSSGVQCWDVDAFRADGTRLPGFPKATHAPNASKQAMPAIADLTGDGLKEIVWVDYDGRVMVWDVAGTPASGAVVWPMSRQSAAHAGALPAH